MFLLLLPLGLFSAIRSRKKSTTLNSWRVVIASWSRWWERRHYELKVRPVGDIFFLIESQSRRLSGRTALHNQCPSHEVPRSRIAGKYITFLLCIYMT
jgi:hypothetical protein